MADKQVTVSVKLLQRCIIWWLWKQGKKPTPIFQDLTVVFEEETYSLQGIKYWLHEFRSGRDKIEDMQRSGHPRSARTEENVEAVLEIVTNERRKRLHEIALEVDVSHTTVHRILRKDLNMRKKLAKFVPRILTPVHLNQRMTACRDNLDWFCQERRLFERIITADETYIHLYEPESKEDSKQWLLPGEPRPQKALRGRGTRHSKCMLLVFFDYKGIVHREYFRNQTLTKHVYLAVLNRLLTSIQNRCTEMWRRGDFVLHDDNTSAHRGDIVMRFIGQRLIRTLTHPPYSPDLAPCDFWFFPRLKKLLRGIRFPDLNTLEFEADRLMGDIPSQDFRTAILEKWPHRMRRCVRANGHYFEGMPH